MSNENSSLNNSVKGDLPLLFNATKAADTLGISPRSLWTLTRAGTIPFIQLGRRVMYSPSSLQNWVARNTFVGGVKNGKSLQG
jgi:Helix-turn-helix domain